MACKGIYEHAIERLGTPNKYEFRKDPEEGFVEHLMIAFFNEWLDLGDAMLDKFFLKASAELRGHAARLLTTSFKPEREAGGIIKR